MNKSFNRFGKSNKLRIELALYLSLISKKRKNILLNADKSDRSDAPTNSYEEELVYADKLYSN